MGTVSTSEEGEGSEISVAVLPAMPACRLHSRGNPQGSEAGRGCPRTCPSVPGPLTPAHPSSLNLSDPIWQGAMPFCLPVWVIGRMKRASGQKGQFINSLWLCNPQENGPVLVPPGKGPWTGSSSMAPPGLREDAGLIAVSHKTAPSPSPGSSSSLLSLNFPSSAGR